MEKEKECKEHWEKCDVCGFEGEYGKFSESLLYIEQEHPELMKAFGKTNFHVCLVCYIKSRGIKTLDQKAEIRSSTARMFGGRGLGKDKLGKDIDMSAGCPK